MSADKTKNNYIVLVFLIRVNPCSSLRRLLSLPALPPEHRLAAAVDLVHAAGAGAVGRSLDELRIHLHFLAMDAIASTNSIELGGCPRFRWARS